MTSTYLRPSRSDMLQAVAGFRKPLIWAVNAITTSTVDPQPVDISSNSFQLTVYDARINNSDTASSLLENSATVSSSNIAATYISDTSASDFGTTYIQITRDNAAPVLENARPHGRYFLEDLSTDELLCYGTFEVVLLTDL